MTVRLSILAGRTGFAKPQVYPMPYREGKPGQSRQDEMPDFAFMNVIVMKGSGPKGQEEKPEQKNRGHSKLSMLQISTKEGRGCNQ
jgi:hypothetical protein